MWSSSPASGFDDFADLSGQMSQVGNDVVIAVTGTASRSLAGEDMETRLGDLRIPGSFVFG